jgi:hypothetical protein
MRTVVVLAEAAEDVESARDFYDAQEVGVGDYCVYSLLADIESLTLYHGIHARQFGFYRMLASRFPFGIYYRETKAQTQVIAVLEPAPGSQLDSQGTCVAWPLRAIIDGDQPAVAARASSTVLPAEHRQHVGAVVSRREAGSR